MIQSLPQVQTPRPAAGLCPRRRTRAFTILELLIAVSVIMILILITAPFLSAMQEGIAMSSAENSIKVAVTSARAYATRPIEFQRTNWSDYGYSTSYDGRKGNYDGTVVIFVWDSEAARVEIRILQNDETVEDASNGIPFELQTSPIRNAYTEIEGRDPIYLPGQVGVAGIRRGGDAEMWSQNFAVRYDNDGSLISRGTGSNEHGWVYFDSVKDGTISSASQGGTYPDSAASVVAVAIFDIRDFIQTTGISYPWGYWDNLPSSERNTIHDYIRDADKTEILYFSRYSGGVMSRDITQ